MKKLANDWKTYRTRFLVQAKQLTAPLRFFDSLGREHSGVAGDYLVEYSGGVLRIAPRQLFEDIYVPIETEPKKLPGAAVSQHHSFKPDAMSPVFSS